MRRSFITELLQKFTSKQMKEFGEFVHSPFFNKNESVVSLFDYLRLHHPEFKPEKIEKEYIYKKLYSASEYNDSFMRMVIFKLTSLAEEYLAYIDFKNKDTSEGMHLINSLLEYNLDKEAQKHIREAEKKLKAAKTLNREYYKNRYELEKLKDVIYSRSYRAVTIKDKPDESLLEESNYLSAFFIISALQRYRYLLNKSFTVNTEYKTDFLSYIMEFLESGGKHYLEILNIRLLYRQILILKDHSREDLLFELAGELTSDELKIDDEERREGLTVLVNICIEKGYEGKYSFYELMFKLDKYLISKNLYNRVKGGYFENEMFLNMVTIGLRLNEIDWTKDFIEKNYKKLSPDTQLNMYNYCYTKLYFKTGDFKKALESIAKVAYSELHMKINVRITSIMINFELGNIEEVLMQIENFKKYIQNDKLLSPGHKRITSNFIKYMAVLCKAKYSTRYNTEELRKNIESIDQISNRTWLLNKVDELKTLRD